jgi:hypothetical protein
MTPLAWMVGASLVSWSAVAAVGGARTNPEALFGMLGPLASAAGTWIAIALVHRQAPGRLTAVMVIGFAAKMVFFGAYVVLMLRGMSLRPVPFVVSLTAYFIALYAMEAFFLNRLLARAQG